jgi:hypothetical protein
LSHGSGDSEWSGYFCDGCSYHSGFPVHHCVESVDGVGGVFDGTAGAIRLHQAVAALYYVSAAAFLLSLEVSGQSVLDVVRVAVLGVGIVVCVDSHGGGYLSDGGGCVGKRSSDGGGCISNWSVSQCWGGTVSHRSSGGYDGGGADDTGAGDGYQGGEDEELKVKGLLEFVMTPSGNM